MVLVILVGSLCSSLFESMMISVPRVRVRLRPLERNCVSVVPMWVLLLVFRMRLERLCSALLMFLWRSCWVMRVRWVLNVNVFARGV